MNTKLISRAISLLAVISLLVSSLMLAQANATPVPDDETEFAPMPPPLREPNAPTEITNAIAVNTFDDQVNGDGDCSLREAVIAANTDTDTDACPAGSGPDTITLPAGTYTLTITGDSAATTIIRNQATDCRHFHIPPVAGTVDFTVQNVTLWEGDGNGGGALAFQETGALTLENVDFIENVASSAGGAVYAQYGTAFIANSNFISNTSGSSGGALYASPTTTATIIGGSFIANVNNGTNDGGAINLGAGSLSISNSSFENNESTAGTSNDGGAIYAAASTDLSLAGTTFKENKADYGGAIGANGAIVITDCDFISNVASTGGGALQSWGTMTVTNSSVLSNTGGSAGGGLRIAGAVATTLDNVEFRNNTATLGGAIAGAGTMTIIASDFVSNTGTSNGGAIHSSGDLNIDNSTFISNTALDGGIGGGGALYLAGGTTTINNSTLNVTTQPAPAGFVTRRLV